MDLILLPGNNAANKEWIEEVSSKVADIFDNKMILYYSHWETGKDMIDLETELVKLSELVKNSGSCLVFAKSAGVILALKGVSEGKIQPSKCVFVGSALLWAEAKGFEAFEWLKSLQAPTLFIQQTNDPAISYEKLKETLSTLNIPNFQILEVPGDDHHYEDTEHLAQLINQFATKPQ